MKIVRLSSVRNARELGGYVNTEGKKVRNGKLLRTAGLNELSDSDLKILTEQYRVTRIVDFRSAYEREMLPDREIPGAENIWISVLNLDQKKLRGGMKTMKTSEDRLHALLHFSEEMGGAAAMYRNLVTSEAGQRGYEKFFRILLDNDEATLWHCSEGKDRTGLAAVYILLALGVDRETALDDFELSNLTYEAKMIDARNMLEQESVSLDKIEAVLALVGVGRHCMEEALDFIDQEYGGFFSYLHGKLHITEEELKRFRQKYLV